MKRIHIVILFLPFISSVFSQDVALVTNLTKENGIYHIFMNCVSSDPPLDNTAEFRVNNKTQLLVKYFNGQCYLKRSLCDMDKCKCTQTSYAVNFAVNMGNYNSFTCVMRFQHIGEGHKVIEATALYSGAELLEKKEVFTIRGAKQDIISSEQPNPAPDKDTEPPVIWLHLLIVGFIVVSLFVLLCVFWKKQKSNMEDQNENEDQTALQILSEEKSNMEDQEENKDKIAKELETIFSRYMRTEMPGRTFCFYCKESFKKSLIYRMSQKVQTLEVENFDLPIQIDIGICPDLVQHDMKIIVIPRSHQHGRWNTNRPMNIEYKLIIISEDEDTRICQVYSYLSRDQTGTEQYRDGKGTEQYDKKVINK